VTTQPKYGEWIKCSDGLPEEGQHVLFLEHNYYMNDMIVARCAKTIQSTFYFQLVTDGNVSGSYYDIDPIYIKETSHWMPLPEPPNE